jgi:hypothetical protein
MDLSPQDIIKQTIDIYKRMIEKLEETKIKNLVGVSPRLAKELGIVQTENKIETLIEKMEKQIDLLEGKLKKY